MVLIRPGVVRDGKARTETTQSLCFRETRTYEEAPSEDGASCTVPAEPTTKVVRTCHATRASITPAAPATLTQPTHDLAPGAAHAARGDIQWVVYLTPCSDSRGYAKCIVNIPELVMPAFQPPLRKDLPRRREVRYHCLSESGWHQAAETG